MGGEHGVPRVGEHGVRVGEHGMTKMEYELKPGLTAADANYGSSH